MKKVVVVIVFIILIFCVIGCKQSNATKKEIKKPSRETVKPSNNVSENTVSQKQTTNIPVVEPTIEPTIKPTIEPTIKPIKEPSKKGLIVIDAGHQAKQDSGVEPIGPGATETKKKVSSGTRGSETGLYEYKLNLIVALKLQNVLENEGYQVIMTRTTNNVDISNAKRAQIANDANADVLIRLHANGSENSSVNGVMTICNTKSNPYNSDIYNQSRKLSELILSGILNTTNANSKGVWETDTMTGINWSKVPTTIVEMGYMTNEKEDKLLATEEYQSKIVQGISHAINQYFEEVE